MLVDADREQHTGTHTSTTEFTLEICVEIRHY